MKNFFEAQFLANRRSPQTFFYVNISQSDRRDSLPAAAQVKTLQGDFLPPREQSHAVRILREPSDHLFISILYAGINVIGTLKSTKNVRI